MSPTTLVDGCFDPIHNGHIAYFREAFELGYPVICSVQRDKYIIEVKRRQPILREGERREVLASIRYLTEVFLIDGSTQKMLSSIRPTIYFKGADWRMKGLPVAELQTCNQLGIQIRFGTVNLNSSTLILSRALGQGR